MAKCPNTQPATTRDSAGRPLHYSTCPECGGYLAILASGRFRTHNPVLKAPNPRIMENVAKAYARGES